MRGCFIFLIIYVFVSVLRTYYRYVILLVRVCVSVYDAWHESALLA